MKTIKIFEPALCCSTGVCGPSVDPELLRITALVNQLTENGIQADRFNLASSPMAFIQYAAVNNLIQEGGVEILPITMIDDQVIQTGKYMSNDDVYAALELSKDVSTEEPSNFGGFNIITSGCGCDGDCC